jgi:alpha-D-ribose 1-methylphosphonate 5-triphosphate synthase subunit PhnG
MMSASQQNPVAIDDTQRRRQRWIGVFARSTPETLEKLLADHKTLCRFQVLRAPECGLVMVRARAGGQGTLFNAGEMTVTRCSVRNAKGTVGHGYVAGRSRRHTELAAQLDAVMQDMDEETANEIINRLDENLASVSQVRQQKSAATRVDYYTIVRGENG